LASLWKSKWLLKSPLRLLERLTHALIALVVLPKAGGADELPRHT
jgi:hypothetical protein